MDLALFRDFLDEEDRVLALLWKTGGRVYCEPVPSQSQPQAMGMLLRPDMDRVPYGLLAYGILDPGVEEQVPQLFLFEAEDLEELRRLAALRPGAPRREGP